MKSNKGRRDFLVECGLGLAGIFAAGNSEAYSRSAIAARTAIGVTEGDKGMETIVIPETYTMSYAFSPYISTLEKGCAYVLKGNVSENLQVAMFFSIGTGATDSTTSSNGAYRAYRWRTANGGYVDPIGIWDKGSTAIKVNAGDEYYKIPIAPVAS